LRKIIPQSVQNYGYSGYYTEAIANLLDNAAIILSDAEKTLLKKGLAGQFLNSKYLTHTHNEIYYYFNGAKLPCLANDPLVSGNRYATVFWDTFLIPCMYNDNHNKEIVDAVEPAMPEGPYGYEDGIFEVTVKKNDIVIDAGAWAGDFSAYAASKGATVYAFEPAAETFRALQKTAELNTVSKIYPIQKGLGNSECETPIYLDNRDGGGNTIRSQNHRIPSEIIKITTLDTFVKENNIQRIDFIKADIEGAERDMLQGATEVLKKFAPKLAICTYHLPDDPEVLKRIILDANPAYKIIQLRKKLYACIC
jgi:FkbM family methyltransferase